MKDLLNYVETNKEVYEKKFTRIQNGQITFNWCAFFVAPLWFLYRRMYLIAGILLGINILLTPAASTAALMGNSWFLYGFDLCLSLACGFLGDRLYYHSAIARSSEGKVGGTAGRLVVLAIVAIFLFSVAGSLFYLKP